MPQTSKKQPLQIHVSKQEIDQIRHFFDQVSSGDAQSQSSGLLPVGSPVFLLLRKLLAYGFYYVPQTNPAIRYQDLQRITTRPDDMLAAVRAYPDEFDQLLAAYIRSEE